MAIIRHVGPELPRFTELGSIARVCRNFDPATSQVVDGVVVTLLFFFPESQVLLEKLDDALGVTEVVLLKLVDLVEGRLQGVVGKLASRRVVLKHFVVEDRKVQGEAELDRVARCQINPVSLFVGRLGLGLGVFERAIFSVLSDVAVVVTNHLDEECLCLGRDVRLAQDEAVDHVDDFLAVIL